METRLERAERHVREGRQIVERQRRLVLDQHQKGHDTTTAEELLQTFERSLSGFEDDLAAIRAK